MCRPRVVVGSVAGRTASMPQSWRNALLTWPNNPLLAKYQPDIKALGWESGTLKAVWTTRAAWICSNRYLL